jgi:DNA-binding response OmpR family regulator
MISQDGHKIILASNGAEIMSYLDRKDVDLCFLQDELLDESGLDFCRAYATGAAVEPIPIVIFSRQAELEPEALAKGAADFLKMPCQSQEALGLVENWGNMICAPSNGEAPATKADPNGNSADDRPLILLVDDSKIIHTFVGNALRESAYRLISAYDGEEGYRTAIERMPDLIISDIDMPHMNGYEMCHQIKENESTRQIPILILSARGSGVDIDRDFDAGANDFLTKPVADNELLSRIEMTLDGTFANQREKILVVEDSGVQRALIVQNLAQQGFEIISGENGEEGLALAISSSPDLVITDSEMPLMNGRDLTRALRKHTELKDVPVLMLTAADDPLNRAKGKHSGVSAYLTKPFVPDKIVVIAEKLIAERRLLRERHAMQYYLSDSAAEAATKAADTVGAVSDVMQAEEKFATVFFTDIVGFTPLTERLPATALVSLLNAYFDAMTPLFREHGGIIDKFIGDAIMAIFIGDEKRSHAESALCAVRTGLAMIDTLALFNHGREERLNIRIGINSGNLIIGDIGAKLHRRDHTVIGDSVNIAARIESAAKHNTVLISEDTHDMIENKIKAQALGPVEMKGKSEPITVYQVESCSS